MNEPTPALDHNSARAIEELTLKLRDDFTIAFVTHNIDQARRIADHVVFICGGEIIE